MEGVPIGEKKKKRGRKPKNKTIVNTGANFDIDPQEDNLIISAKEKKQGSVTNTIPGFEVLNFSEIPSEFQEKQVSLCCWNCAHEIVAEVSYPLKYIDGTFYVYGSFCSFECAAKYITETYHNREMWEKYVLLNHYYNELHDTQNKRVKTAPDRRLLLKFGGTMTIEEYRSESSQNTGYITLPPIFPVNHTVHGNECKNKVTDVHTELKLYRKKVNPKKKDIYSTMNIESVS